MIRLTLPPPPSSNRYWRRVGTRLHMSPEAKLYKAAVAALGAKCVPLTGPVAVTLDWYRERKSGDLDNRVKICLDSLNGVAFVDDKQIVRLVAERYDDKRNPRVEVIVAQYPTPQEAAR